MTTATKAKKMVYFFGHGQADGEASMRNLLGGKGANLAEMTNLGIPVPPGFTISTEVCMSFYANKRKFPQGLKEEMKSNMAKVEKVMDMKFGDAKNPLLVSVRSGARTSMPGMMDTVLNLGLNDETVEGLIAQIKNERAAYDSYRRFIMMYSNVVLGIDKDLFEHLLEEKKKEKGVKLDTELSAQDLKDLIPQYRKIVQEKTNKPFPQDPDEQLWGATGAVFDSWHNKRAITYRKLNKIPDDWGTAVNVQTMVFGNMGEDSATGVAFTRDPATGENVFYGEYLVNAQGEDVVAGVRTPHPLNRLQKKAKKLELSSLEEEMPEPYKKLESIRHKLEKHYRDMQDIEFTIQKGKLWMLQTRTGKRTALASIRIAVEMAQEGLIKKEEAISRIEPDQLDQILHRMFDPKAKKEVIARGLPASPGAATGVVVFSADEAEEEVKKGEKVILVRLETSPEDIHGMVAAEGILTARGGMTSHAAVVARGMGKCCVAGCEAIKVNYKNEQFTVGNEIIKKGDYISIDGTSGEVMKGRVPTADSEITQVVKGVLPAEKSSVYKIYSQLMQWVQKVKRLGIRANADTPTDARIARAFGATGIGLCRTEHMFFGEERLPAVRAMILADNDEERKKALDKLLPFQREDFKGILKAMDGLPVIIRLLDPPLHEFLPKHEELSKEIAKLKDSNGDQNEIARLEKVLAKVAALHEANPMLGHRGCRLGITFPEINRMQARAIFEAACELIKEGLKPFPEVMIPVVGHVNEVKVAKGDIHAVAEEVIKENNVKMKYLIGTMIELPRAALTADEIAKEAEFFSYGTNDLTQTTFGFSRDDIEGKFLPVYIDKKILTHNPFAVLDRKGVGELIRIGIEKGRKTRPNLEVGICGEHGGEPSSVEFCHLANMDYVSCSPYRVPIAQLAAAQAVIKWNH
ncbi:MAG: pyruvate, phosphate dikinase [Candidatus Omnitrophota bacterium]|nr:MAG: pyruvate, phosphate dikinase [Candidatus Omnitrophota bacterium]